jgi:CHAT domain-containing protein
MQASRQAQNAIARTVEIKFVRIAAPPPEQLNFVVRITHSGCRKMNAEIKDYRAVCEMGRRM